MRGQLKLDILGIYVLNILSCVTVAKTVSVCFSEQCIVAIFQRNPLSRSSVTILQNCLKINILYLAAYYEAYIC